MKSASEWRNWATNVRATPSGRVPASTTPLPARFRVAGAGGSSSRLVATDAVLVDGRSIAGEPVLDELRGEVRTPAGLSLGELGTWLARRGWSLPRVGTSAYASVAGAIATASHGTGTGLGSLSDGSSVRGVTVVRPDGVRVELDAGRPGDAEDLAALRVHLGAFGLVTEVRLAVSRGAVLEVETRHAPLDAVLDPAVRAGAAQVEAWWLPGTETVLLAQRRVSTDPADLGARRGLARQRLWAEDVPLHLVTALARFAPGLAQTLLGRFGRGRRRPRRRVGRWDHLAIGSRRYHAVSTEIAVPMPAAREAIAAIRALAREAPLHVPVNLRWNAADEGALLSPALGRAVFWIEVACHPGVPGWGRVLCEVERRLVALGGRPHWGKVGFQNPRALFPELDRWEKVRRRYDPDGRLLNEHLRRLLDGRPLLTPAEAEGR